REGRRHRRSEALQLRSQTAARDFGGGMWFLHRDGCGRNPEILARTTARGWEFSVVRSPERSRSKCSLGQRRESAKAAGVRDRAGLVPVFSRAKSAARLDLDYALGVRALLGSIRGGIRRGDWN